MTATRPKETQNEGQSTPTNASDGVNDAACAWCRGAGFVMTRDQGVVRCPCQVEADAQVAYARAVRASHLTDAMRVQTFASFDRVLAPDAYDLLSTYAASPQGWVVLIGPCGVGKTHLLAATANALLEAGRHPLYTIAPNFLDTLRAGFGSGGVTDDTEARIQEAVTAEVLLLDDLGAEYATGWAEDRFYRLLNDRYNSQRPTVIATNLFVDQLPERLASRLSDTALVQEITLTGEDYRVNRGRKHGRN